MFQLIDFIKGTAIHKPTIMGEPTSEWIFETREAAIKGADVLGYELVWNDCFLPKDGEYNYKRPIWLKLKEVTT